MNFSQALTLAKNDRLRIARKLWSSVEWFRCADRTPGRTIEYVMALDGRAFGAPVSATLHEPSLGPMVRVRLFGVGGGVVVSAVNYEIPLDDALATDWEVVDDATVAKIVKNLGKPWPYPNKEK